MIELPEDACFTSRVWCRPYDTLQQAWDACHRGDWMLWYLGRQGKEYWPKSRYEPVRSPLVACVVECVETLAKCPPMEDINLLKSWLSGQEIDWPQFYNKVYSSPRSLSHIMLFSAVAPLFCDFIVYKIYASWLTSNHDKVRKDCANIIRKHFPKAPT